MNRSDFIAGKDKTVESGEYKSILSLEVLNIDPTGESNVYRRQINVCKTDVPNIIHFPISQIQRVETENRDVFIFENKEQSWEKGEEHQTCRIVVSNGVDYRTLMPEDEILQRIEIFYRGRR